LATIWRGALTADFAGIKSALNVSRNIFINGCFEFIVATMERARRDDHDHFLDGKLRMTSDERATKRNIVNIDSTLSEAKYRPEYQVMKLRRMNPAEMTRQRGARHLGWHPMAAEPSRR
jgi:hypothetical protein